MGKGRGGAVVAMSVLTLLLVSLQCEVAKAASITAGDTKAVSVGGTKGWAMGVKGWEKGKTFKAGDTLVFHYPKDKHNVVVVNKTRYDACKAAPNDKEYKSGDDQINLVKGDNFFICTFPSHCDSMKIQVTAS